MEILEQMAAAITLFAGQMIMLIRSDPGYQTVVLHAADWVSD